MPILSIASIAVLLVVSPHSLAQQGNRDVTFDLSEWAELNMQMEEGATIDWDVRSTEGGEFYLDLHSHQGGRPTFHEQFDSTSRESGAFTAPSDGTYSIYVQALDDSDVRIRLQVIGEFEVESEEGIEPIETNGSPAAGLPLILLGGISLAAFCRDRHRRRR